MLLHILPSTGGSNQDGTVWPRECLDAEADKACCMMHAHYRKKHASLLVRHLGKCMYIFLEVFNLLLTILTYILTQIFY